MQRLGATGRVEPGNDERIMEDAIYDLTYRLEENYWWYTARRGVILDQIYAVLTDRKTNEKPRIFEYGCGTGITLASLASSADVFGMDLSEKALAYCKKRGLENLRVIDSDQPLDESNPFGEPFDIVLILDVLEHIADERTVLRTLRSWLKPNGALIVTVPAFPFLWSGEDCVSHHLRRYTKRSLREVIEDSGFQIMRGTYFNCFLFPLQAGVILANRLFFPNAMRETNLKSLPQMVNTVLTRIMSSERYLLNTMNLPFGGSILNIARPRNECEE